MDDYADILRGVQETNEKIGSLLERMNTAPLDTSIQTSTPVSTVGDVPQTNFRRGSLSPEERVYMSSELSRKSDAEISMLVSSAMRKRDAGIPLDHWLAAGGYTLQNALGEMQSNHLDLDVAKAIDTSGVSVLIRQDLEPLLY